eukprot:CAMPEP_0117429030 /NCGR_PEP_ID=MMETSP0758-20121206/8610_1 /TAXON_ID=63605 /ORGANISM="Percolomonas cosmopolitus, Strain AE-1 (ATCC 50343)" /LENGTH=33 /DNA_ID= /DNA_START= /DNA_END= /DNA_ORIENTATION=
MTQQTISMENVLKSYTNKSKPSSMKKLNIKYQK